MMQQRMEVRVAKSKRRPRRRRSAEPARDAEGEFPSFAKALEQHSGLRQASFTVPARDLEPIQAAKRRFGTLRVARFVGAVVRALIRLTRGR